MFSVIINFYNETDYIELCIESVLSQTRLDLISEILIVNDAGLDISSIVEAYDSALLKYVYIPTNQGLAAARNTAVELSKSEYIAFLDADDIWHKGKLEAQFEAITKDKSDFCYSGVVNLYKARRKIIPGKFFADKGYEFIRCCYPIYPSTTVIGRRVFLASGGFPTELRNAQDTYLFARLLNDCKASVLREALVTRSIGEHNISSDWRKKRKYLSNALDLLVLHDFRFSSPVRIANGKYDLIISRAAMKEGFIAESLKYMMSGFQRSGVNRELVATAVYITFSFVGLKSIFRNRKISGI